MDGHSGKSIYLSITPPVHHELGAFFRLRSIDHRLETRHLVMLIVNNMYPVEKSLCWVTHEHWGGLFVHSVRVQRVHDLSFIITDHFKNRQTHFITEQKSIRV